MSTYFNINRKLALYSACNYYKDAFQQDVSRSNSFRDDEIGSKNQTENGFYLSNENNISKNQNHFDRGHLIARRYNQWGKTLNEAKEGESDTYFFTNIVPQVGRDFNQDEWEDLEDFIITKGKLDVQKISVFAGVFFI